METFSALLDLCAGNSPVTGEFPAQRPVTWSFDVSFDLRLNKRLRKQSWGWWFETPSRSLWYHCNTRHWDDIVSNVGRLSSVNNQYLGYWWSGGARRLGICDHGIDIVCLWIFRPPHELKYNYKKHAFLPHVQMFMQEKNWLLRLCIPYLPIEAEWRIYASVN